jgi:hypothetical protein
MAAARIRALFRIDLDAIAAGARLQNHDFFAVAKYRRIVGLVRAGGTLDGHLEIEAALLDANEVGLGPGDIDVVAVALLCGVRRRLRLAFEQRNRSRRLCLHTRRGCRSARDP